MDFENLVAEQGEAFRIITASGLRFRVDVTYEGSG